MNFSHYANKYTVDDEWREAKNRKLLGIIIGLVKQKLQEDCYLDGFTCRGRYATIYFCVKIEDEKSIRGKLSIDFTDIFYSHFLTKIKELYGNMKGKEIDIDKVMALFLFYHIMPLADSVVFKGVGNASENE